MTDTTTPIGRRDSGPRRGDWREAGRGWGARAKEWAYLFEPYARPANQRLFDELAVGPGTRYLDVACGSGLAANTAAGRGASVTGLDAAGPLIDIARARTPDADFRVGDMFELPFDNGSFDVVTSFNGIWNGCDDALREVRRVVVEEGRVGLTYWGSYERMGMLPFFLAVIEHSPPSHQAATTEMGKTADVVEDMLRSTGFEVEATGAVEVINEWPDVDTAVRALASAGPAIPVIESIGYEGCCAELRDIVTPMYDPKAGVRISSELAWVTARPC